MFVSASYRFKNQRRAAEQHSIGNIVSDLRHVWKEEKDRRDQQMPEMTPRLRSFKRRARCFLLSNRRIAARTLLGTGRKCDAAFITTLELAWINTFAHVSKRRILTDYMIRQKLKIAR
jgi:hypothetical protein